MQEAMAVEEPNPLGDSLVAQWAVDGYSVGQLTLDKNTVLQHDFDPGSTLPGFHELCRLLHLIFCHDTDIATIHQKNRVVFDDPQTMRSTFRRFLDINRRLLNLLDQERFTENVIRLHGEERVDEYQGVLKSVLNNLFFAHEHMQASYLQSYVNDPRQAASLDLESQILKNVIVPEPVELKDHQKLYNFLLDQCRNRMLRKQKTGLFAPKYTPEGNFTFFFEHCDDISTWMYKMVDPRECYTEQWSWFTDKYTSRKHLAELLEHCWDPRLPYIQKCRTMFAFRNGVYEARANRFYPYVPEDGWPYHTGQLKQTLVCANYLDHHFDFRGYADSLRINADPVFLSTPNCQAILTSQNFDREVSRWFYASMGRLVFAVGDLDNWQFFPFIKGVAGTGKSTLLDIFSGIYDKMDTGIMMSQAQTNFSIEHLADAFVFFCTEVDRNMTLQPTIWNSMVSGESVVVDRKFKVSVSQKWTSPGVFAGNVFPPWVDNGGNVSRRMLMFLFDELVKVSDPLLPEKCKQELPAYLYKCVSCYHDLLGKYQRKSIWDEGVLPAYFHDAKAKTMGSTNSMQAFLNDRTVCRLGPDYQCSEVEFKNHYRDYCQKEKVQNYVRYSDEVLYKPIWYRNSVTKIESASIEEPVIIRGVGLLGDVV